MGIMEKKMEATIDLGLKAPPCIVPSCNVVSICYWGVGGFVIGGGCYLFEGLRFRVQTFPSLPGFRKEFTNAHKSFCNDLGAISHEPS